MESDMRETEMTEEQIKALVARVASETAEKAVNETLVRLGLTVGDPFEMQADMQHLRAWRKSVSTVKRQGLITAVGILVAGLIALVMTEFHVKN